MKLIYSKFTFKLLAYMKKNIIIFEKTLTFWLKYNSNFDHYKIFYIRSSLVDNVDSNYIKNLKSRQLSIYFSYYFNIMAVFWLSKKVKKVAIFSNKIEYIILNNISK